MLTLAVILLATFFVHCVNRWFCCQMPCINVSREKVEPSNVDISHWFSVSNSLPEQNGWRKRTESDTKFTTAALKICSVKANAENYRHMHMSYSALGSMQCKWDMMNESGFAIYANLMFTMYYSRPQAVKRMKMFMHEVKCRKSSLALRSSRLLTASVRLI